MNYTQIKKLPDPKEKLFATMDRIEELKKVPSMIGLSRDEEIELANLEEAKMNYWSEWKDPD